MESKKLHTSVLLKESIDLLNIRSDGFYIDCTLGEAGHSIEILKKLNSSGLLLSIDRDQHAIDFVKQKYPQLVGQKNWTLAKSNFSELRKTLNKLEINKPPDGILFDLGLSSRQLETKGRGFSYMEEDDQLDMRMDQDLAVDAKDLLTVLSEYELTKLFKLYGEERFASRIAKSIKNSPTEIKTVSELNALVDRAMPAASKSSSKHPARRVYQALRIAVNDELNSISIALNDSFELLGKDGTLVVISFHSLEDRIVKRFFNQKVKDDLAIHLNSKPVLPTEEELNENSRARSAKLRAIKKLKG